jgi:hypothetical protein
MKPSASCGFNHLQVRNLGAILALDAQPHRPGTKQTAGVVSILSPHGHPGKVEEARVGAAIQKKAVQQESGSTYVSIPI